MEYHVADDTEHRYDETEVVWSFAYGANMNRDSLDKRKVTPLRTLPAILRNYSFKFNLNGIMGNVQPCEGEEVHGLVHLLTLPDQRKLEQAEGKGRIYDLYQLLVTTYDGQELWACVFVGMPAAVQPGDGRPPERYRNIILQAAHEFGLQERWITYIESFDYVKSRRPEDYYRFPVLPRTPENLYTKERFDALFCQLTEKKARGEDVRVTLTLLKDKIIRLRVAEKVAEQFLHLVHNFEGKDIALWFCSVINEPSLSKVQTLDDLTEQHYAWVEDQLLGEMSQAWVEDCQVIGYLEDVMPLGLPSFLCSA